MPGAVAKLYRGQPAAAVGILYTTPAGQKTLVRTIAVTNTTAAVATLTLHLVDNGGAPSAANALVYALPVQPNSIVVIEVKQVLSAGDTIRGLQGTAAALTIHISGVENAP